MKKFFKITGIVLGSILGLLIVAVIVIRVVVVINAHKAAAKESAEATERYVGMLRSAGEYAADTVQFRFAYRQDEAHAREIREYFCLDTLLNEKATTWDNSLALAKFVALNIPHANQKIHPDTRNAIALWEYHLDVEPGFNCRLHSIMLHELLLASGITNRFVTCFPVDPDDPDCHVVNIVWLPELQKWAMIDSDMQRYITDPAGMPLSLEEMRRSYINDEPMKILRFRKGRTNYSYRPYWAKNLYWFSSWEEFGYDKEVDYKGRMIVLLPEGFEGFRLWENSITTTDSERFWAAPETTI